MSTVELAVRKVKKLSATPGQGITGLVVRTAAERHCFETFAPHGRAKLRPGVPCKKLCVARFRSRNTDWTPPRMPDDLANPSSLNFVLDTTRSARRESLAPIPDCSTGYPSRPGPSFSSTTVTLAEVWQAFNACRRITPTMTASKDSPPICLANIAC